MQPLLKPKVLLNYSVVFFSASISLMNVFVVLLVSILDFIFFKVILLINDKANL